MKITDPFDEFGCLLFDETLMQERLPYPIYKRWKETVAKEDSLDRNTADAIAHAMKRWAQENGATHFTHWFQPMTRRELSDGQLCMSCWICIRG